MALKLTLDKSMISEVMEEWEQAHPGRRADEMTPDEFGERMMAKIMGTAEIVPTMPPHPRRQ